MAVALQKGETIIIRPGDYFNLLLPDGSFLRVEQTNDDFSITRGNDLVAYEKPTSEFAINRTNNQEQTTGSN